MVVLLWWLCCFDNRRGKSDTSVKDSGAGGDGENLIQCSLCDAKVVQLVRHIRAVHGDDPDYDSKIKEARSLEAKVQSSATPSKKVLFFFNFHGAAGFIDFLIVVNPLDSIHLLQNSIMLDCMSLSILDSKILSCIWTRSP